jgi:hypothetical protein
MAQRKSVTTRTTPSPSRRFGRPVAAGTSPQRPSRSRGSAKSPSRTASQGGSPRWRPRNSPKSQSTLSELTKSVQSALPFKSTKKVKGTSKGSRRSASALALLVGSAAAAFGGRQLQKRKQGTEPALTDGGYSDSAHPSAPNLSGSSSAASTDAASTQPYAIADPHPSSANEAPASIGSDSAALNPGGEQPLEPPARAEAPDAQAGRGELL